MLNPKLHDPNDYGAKSHPSTSTIPKVVPRWNSDRLLDNKKNSIRSTVHVDGVTELLHSFSPIVDMNARVLILGTMPSTVSLAKKEYYANPRNHFWSIMYEVFDQSRYYSPTTPYSEKITFLKQNRVALWDVLEECERDGSGDLDIKNGKSNNFGKFLSEYRDIRCVVLNGQKANKLFFRANDERSFQDVKFLCLPSTSPANAGISFKEKVGKWRSLRTCSEAPDSGCNNRSM
jgi:hypoxanthine-DNA glycosylase